MSAEAYCPDMLPEYLLAYYKRLFPYNLFVRWLSYGQPSARYFAYREFSFTLQGDIYMRYKSFADQAEFSKEMQRVQPIKIDIGAVYSHRPKDNKSVQSQEFFAKQKELVFDIDMTDYDDVRYCCSGAAICLKCWTLMRMAVKILNRALREDFGFKHLLWVYSGRRGVHCWVADESARALPSAARTAIAEYLSLVKGGSDQAKKVNLTASVHPSIREAIGVIEKQFAAYAAGDQEFLSTVDRVANIIKLLPADMHQEKERLVEKWDEPGDSTKRWNTLSRYLMSKKMENVVAEIELQFCYPRLDVNVSTGVNHLLKSPFCVHPKTGRVCVPFDPLAVDTFDPFGVPLVSEIVDEISRAPTDSDRLLLYKHTSLKEAIRLFENFVSDLAEDGRNTRLTESDMNMQF